MSGIGNMRGLGARMAANRVRQQQGQKGQGGIFGKPKQEGHGAGAGAGAGGGNAGNGAGGNGGFKPWRALSQANVRGILTPKQLHAAARGLAVLENRPEIREYGRIGRQLQQEKAREAQGLEHLGARTSGTVSSAYQGIAQAAAESVAREQALANSLNTNSAKISAQGANELSQMQTGALGDYEQQLQMRGAQNTQGYAEQALAQATNAEADQRASYAQAAQNLAAQQGAGSVGLLGAQQMAAQQKGSEAITGIGRVIANRIGESNAKYNQNIQQAREKRAEAKAKIGPSAVKDFLQLRQQEREHQEAEQAIAGKKSEAKAAAAEAAAERAEAKAEREAKGKQQGFENALSLRKLGLEEWEAHHPNASSGEAAKKAAELRQERENVRSVISVVYGQLNKNATLQKPSEQAEFEKALIKESKADPRIVSKVFQHWLKNRFNKLGHDVNGASLGR